MHANLTTKFAVGILLFVGCSTLHADTFGSGANAFTIDFVYIGNAGNADDMGAGGGIYSTPYGGVAYDYRMGKYEIPQDAITLATAGGLTGVTAGAWAELRPAANITWYEAAAFVNWLNTSTGHQAAYQLDAGNTTMTLWSSAQASQVEGGQNRYRHKDAYYFLPSEDEWYKAAYHKNDGVTANYWDYATGSNSIPTMVVGGTGAGTAVYNVFPGVPADVDRNGGLSAYGTRGQDGNVFELIESAYDGVNDFSTEDRAIRGGSWSGPDFPLRSSGRAMSVGPTNENTSWGFRVASLPEPSVAILLLGSGLLFAGRGRQRRSL